jgi:hypothetical protein
MMTLACFEQLPPAPPFCRSAQLTDRGIVLGEGVVLAPLARRDDGGGVLVVEGREAEIFALLSLARGGAIRPNVLHGLHGVAKSFGQGEIVGAMIRLAQIGLPPLRGPRDAEMLKTGANFLDKGFSPQTLLRAAGIGGPDGPDVADAPDNPDAPAPATDWNPDLHPRDPATGRFVETGGADAAPTSAEVPASVGATASVAIPASIAERLIAGGAAEVSAGAFALAGGVLLSLGAAGWVLSHGPQGDIQDGASYWLPGVSSDNASDGDGDKPDAPGLGHNGGPALDQTSEQQPQDPNQKPEPTVVAPLTSSGSSQQSGDAQTSNSRSMSDILLPNGEPVGYVYSRADSDVRTVPPE